MSEQKNHPERELQLPGRKLPVIADVDLIIAGGTVGGVAAAAEAAQAGLKVFLIGYQPYLGDDVCGNYKYLFEPQAGDHPLLRELFPADTPPTPLRIKTVLEDKLLDHGVDYLYSSYITDIRWDAPHERFNVTIVNRTGRQLLRSRVLIDATQAANAARMAGADFTTDSGDTPKRFQLISIGNQPKPGLESRPLPLTQDEEGRSFQPWEFTFTAAVESDSFRSRCQLEQQLRGEIWDPDQVDAADNLFYIPSTRLQSASGPGSDEAQPIETLPIDRFRPKNGLPLFVLGPCADVSRAAAAELVCPQNAISLGERIAKTAANTRAAHEDAVVGQTAPAESTPASGVIHETRQTLRSSQTKDWAAAPTQTVPVWDTYDVLIIGGGTAGANAAISAAREGAKTLVVEYLHGLGGMGTVGLIGRYFDGYREGFTAEIDRAVAAMAPADHPDQKTDPDRVEWPIPWKMEWYRQEILKAGGEIWFGAFGCGAVVDQNTVTGVLLAAPEGLAVIMAKVIIDSTGSADIAAAAGATPITHRETTAVQGAGLPGINLGDHYNNTDWTFINDNDILDVTRLYTAGKAKEPAMFDLGKIPQTRERRRVTGEYQVSVLDIVNERRYSDTISFHRSAFDTHGYTIHPYFTIKPPAPRHTLFEADVPLRSLLPAGLDGIIVTGLGASAERDAMPVIRMQPCLQNQGYSVGYLSALAVKNGCSVRAVDLKQVQSHLVEKSILPARVLTDTDTPAFSDSELQEAVRSLPDGFAGLSVILAEPAKAIPLLKDAYTQADTAEAALSYAQTLCMLGEADGLAAVTAAVDSYAQWDEGWNYTGLGQFGPCMSRLDSLIMALGETCDPAVLPSVLTKAKLLTTADAFSHFRAVSLVCESTACPEAAPVLAALLALPGIQGHHVHTFKQARQSNVPSRSDVSIRNKVLRELYLARALFRCGDHQDRGKTVLENYAQDLHSYYFQYAAAGLCPDSPLP